HRLRAVRAGVLRHLPGVRQRAAVSPYVVRRLRPAAFMPLLAIPVFVTAVEVLGLPGFPVLFIVVFAAFSAYVGWQRTIVLKVDAGGVQIGRGVEYAYGRQQLAGATVPWPSIREVVV